MRSRLSRLAGKRRKFSAEVFRFGSRRNGDGLKIQTVLLGDIRLENSHRQVARYVWKDFSELGVLLSEGDRVSFFATVSPYVKGHKRWRALSGASLRKRDWTLDNITVAHKIV